ncbi:MAG: response regulator transcription factor [Oligoflexia bacterium]|nr:response regulator transcription factor [Oligoflexia bacterium]
MKKIRLLILEDNEIFQSFFLEFSQRSVFEVIGFCKNSKELLKQVEEKKPEVVLIDLVIPKDDILTLIERLKSLYPQLPLIACSSLTEDTIVSKVLKAGCFDYIFKPFREEDFVESIKSAVA